MPQIDRLTIFKLSSPDAIDTALAKYETLLTDAKKNGTPYLTLATATALTAHPLSQGYNFLARVGFESKEDMEFYDTQCEAHKGIKAALAGKLEGMPLMVCSDGI